MNRQFIRLVNKGTCDRVTVWLIVLLCFVCPPPCGTTQYKGPKTETKPKLNRNSSLSSKWNSEVGSTRQRFRHVTPSWDLHANKKRGILNAFAYINKYGTWCLVSLEWRMMFCVWMHYCTYTRACCFRKTIRQQTGSQQAVAVRSLNSSIYCVFTDAYAAVPLLLVFLVSDSTWNALSVTANLWSRR